MPRSATTKKEASDALRRASLRGSCGHTCCRVWRLAYHTASRPHLTQSRREVQPSLPAQAHCGHRTSALTALCVRRTVARAQEGAGRSAPPRSRATRRWRSSNAAPHVRHTHVTGTAHVATCPQLTLFQYTTCEISAIMTPSDFLLDIALTSDKKCALTGAGKAPCWRPASASTAHVNHMCKAKRA